MKSRSISQIELSLVSPLKRERLIFNKTLYDLFGHHDMQRKLAQISPSLIKRRVGMSSTYKKRNYLIPCFTLYLILSKFL